MKKIILKMGLALGLASQVYADGNRIENMVLVAEGAALGRDSAVVLPTSPVPFIRDVHDVNALDRLWVAPISELIGLPLVTSDNFRADMNAIWHEEVGWLDGTKALSYSSNIYSVCGMHNNLLGGRGPFDPEQCVFDARSGAGGTDMQFNFFTLGLTFTTSKPIGVFPTFGKVKAGNLQVGDMSDIEDRNLYQWNEKNKYLPASFVRSWVMKGDLVIEDASDPFNVIQIGKAKGKQDGSACRMSAYINGKKVLGTDTAQARSFKISAIKKLRDLKPGRHSIVGLWACDGFSDPSVHFDVMKIGVVQEGKDERLVLPVSTFKVKDRKPPVIGNIPSVSKIERLGWSRWTSPKSEKLDFTDMDMLKTEDQDIGLSNTNHVKQVLVEDVFYPKDTGVYKFYIETESNVCAKELIRMGKDFCSWITHPSYILSFDGNEVIVAAPAFNAVIPYRNNFGTFFATERDVANGVSFVYSARGRLPIKNAPHAVRMKIADVEEDYQRSLNLSNYRSASFGTSATQTNDGYYDNSFGSSSGTWVGHTRNRTVQIPAAVPVTNAFTGAKAIQKVRLWVKGPKDAKFRPLYDYDFKEGPID